MKIGNLVTIKNYVTPDLRDVIFFENVDATLFKEECYPLGLEHSCEPDFKLVYIGPETTSDDRKKRRKLYYAADRQEQYKYNYTFDRANPVTGGQYDSYRRLCVIPREDYNVTDYADLIGEPDPDASLTLDKDGDEVFPSGEFVLMGEKLQRSNIKELDSCYVFVLKVYAKLCAITTAKWDTESQSFLETTVTPCPNKDNPQNVPMDVDGVVTSVQGRDCNWSLCVQQGLIDVNVVKTYKTSTTMSWPAVLNSMEFMIWNRRDGQKAISPRIIWDRRAGSYPTILQITETYSTTQLDYVSNSGVMPDPVGWIANSIQYRCPSFSVSIPACLHAEEAFICDYGNNDPVWNFTTGSDRTYPETILTDGTPAPVWPASIVIQSTQTPYKGGWKQRVVTAFAPL